MKKLIKIITILLLSIFISIFILMYLYPPFLYRYCKPTGSYCVSNNLLHITHDTLNNINGFNIEIFYPNNKTEQKQFLYRPNYINAIREVAAQTTKTPTALWHILLPNLYPFIQPHAPPTQSIPKIPVIIYLPGIGGIDLNLVYLSELTSHGYIVCSIEPPGDIAVTVLPDGRKILLHNALKQAIKENNRKSIYAYRNQAHKRWVKYINTTISQLHQLNHDPNNMFYQRIDLENIGILGASHGGAVALDYCQNSTQCKAGINLDGWTKTYNSTKKINVPFLLLIGEHGGIINIAQTQELINNNQQATFKTKIISDAYHGSFDDSILTPWPWSYFFGGYLKNPIKTRTEISTTIIDFFNLYLKNISKNTRPLALINLNDHPWILQAQNTIEPLINTIIKNAILRFNPKATTFPKFYVKQRHLITLLYSKQVPIELEESIIKIFKKITVTKYPTLSELYFSDDLDFFGKDNSELVVKINDPNECLPTLRNFIIDNLPTSLHDQLATKEHNQFKFAPHETLGRIPVSEIQELSNADTIKTIRQHILKEVPPLLHQLSASINIKPTELFVYGNDFKPIFTQNLT